MAKRTRPPAAESEPEEEVAPEVESKVEPESVVRVIGAEGLPEDIVAEIVRIATLKGAVEVTVAAVGPTSCVVWIGGTPVKIPFVKEA